MSNSSGAPVLLAIPDPYKVNFPTQASPGCEEQIGMTVGEHPPPQGSPLW